MRRNTKGWRIPDLRADSTPGSEDILLPAVRDCHQAQSPKSRQAEKRKFPPQFCRALAHSSQPGAWPGLESCSQSGKCWLRLGFPVPGPGVQAESQEAHVTMSPCQCLCPQSRPQSNLISGHRRTPASQIKSALDKEISHSKTAEYKLLELRVELRV